MARTVKCPSCGADLTVKDENRDFMFCEYCGTKVRLDDYQETHRFVDEAKVKRVEAFKDLAMKKMEVQERKREEERKDKNKALIICGIGFIVVMIICLLGTKGYI